jgi:hypothetical protein
VGEAVNKGLSYAKAPFKKFVNQGAKNAFEALGIVPPASAISNSPVVQGAEGLASKFIGGGGIAERARNAASGILDSAQGTVTRAGDPRAVLAGRNIANEVLGAEANAAGREAMGVAEQQAFDAAEQGGRQRIAASTLNPQDAALAGQRGAAGFHGARQNFNARKNAAWEGLDLSEPVAMEDARESIAALRANQQGSLTARDLAYLDSFEQSIAPLKMADIGGGQLVPVDQVPAEFRALVPVIEVPRPASEIRSALVGLREKVPYQRGGDVLLASDALRQKLAGIVGHDLEDSLSPDVAAAYQAANRTYSEGVEPFKSQWGRQVSKASREGRISDIPDVVNPRTAPEEVGQIFRTMGPDAARSMRANVLERVVGPARDAAGSVNPERLGREMARWGNLDAILEPNQMQALQRLGAPIPEFPMPTAPTQGPQTAAEMLSGSWGKAIKGQYASGQPEKIVETIVRQNSSPQEIQAAIRAAGSPEARREIQASAIQRILGISPDGDLSKITPEKLRVSLKNWEGARGERKLATFLEADQVKALKDILRASQALGTTGKITGGSQTAFLQSLARIPERAAESPLKALRTLGLEAVVAKLLGSQGGQKWLTTGLGKSVIPGNVVRGTGVVGARGLSELERQKRQRELQSVLGSR